MEKYIKQFHGYYNLLNGAILAWAFLLCGINVSAQAPRAQAINITVSILPPYSPYYSDYSGANASKVLLIVQNLSDVQQKVKLAGKLQGDNGVLISTRNNYIPLQPLILNPHETRQMNGTALKDIFDLNNLNVYGVDKAKLAQSSRIPEGNYSFCIQANDYNTNKVLSASAPLGCTAITITNPEPPVLVSPIPNARVRQTPVQNVVLNWINPGTVPMGTQYKLEIAEMPDVAKDPNQVLNATSFPILSTVVTGTSYVYDAKNLALKPGKRYAWRVTSTDPGKRVVFRNNGTSQASVFLYEPGDSPLAQNGRAPITDKVLSMPGKKYEISGSLTYQYHTAPGEVPNTFKGRGIDAIPLRYNTVQLCYGRAIVNMDIVKKLISETKAKVRPSAVNKGNEVNRQNDGKALISANDADANYIIDSIPRTGLPLYADIAPAEDNNPELGTVLATAKTDTNGHYKFNFATDKHCYIIETISNQKAYIYCYYINVKNKHYTDPRQYVYVKAPEDDETATAAVGNQNVFINNYKLNVQINRNSEAGTGIGMSQNVSVEKADQVAQVFILRKGQPSTAVPKDEGDNTGRVKFSTDVTEAQTYFANSSYYIVETADVAMKKDPAFGLIPSYFGERVFYNLLDNLSPGETYYVYAQYKNSKVFFKPKEFSLEPTSDSEFQPALAPQIRSASIELRPESVSILVKGVLKYRFKNGSAKPLANTTVSLESIYFSYDFNTKDKVFDESNKEKKNEIYGTVKTDANGFFSLTASQILYAQYKAANAKVFGWGQFIKVHSPYYGSPDVAYNLEAGNTYNVGDVVAQVKEYSMNVEVSGINTSTGLKDKLPGQRVFICRKPSVDIKQLGIPDDEGAQNTVPMKSITDADQNAYRAISYAETDSKGVASFNRLVVQDRNNGDDTYYIYSESGILSASNYSTEYGISSNIKQKIIPAIRPVPVSNSILLKTNVSTTHYIESKPQKPFIDGAVYPQTNTSTNALPGVSVWLYDIEANNPDYTAAKFENIVEILDPFSAIGQWISAGKARLQTLQQTPASGLFVFSDPVTDKFKGWKLLIYSKEGFISGYDIINAGKPMGAGVKQNVKGFILPPKLLYVKVKDQNTGAPVKAKIVVGDNFSWQQTKSFVDFTDPSKSKEEAVLTSTYGKVVFTVIPEDNVNYHTQKFTRTITKPTTFLGKSYSDQKAEAINDFEMSRPMSHLQVIVNDADNGKPLGGLVTIEGLAVNETPAALLALPNKPASFEIVTDVEQFVVRVKTAGYVTQDIVVKSNTDPYSVTLVKVEMERGLNINGYVTVDKKPVKNAKVYIKELSGVYPEVYTDYNGYYEMSGLPVNYASVAVVATAPELNAAGSTQNTTLSYPPAPNGKQQKHERKIDFNLVSNKQFDLTTLYGFPLEVESFTRKQNGNYFLTGRVKLKSNANIKAATDKYLSISQVEIVTPNISNRGGGFGGEQSNTLSALKPVKEVVTSVENTINVYAFNYPAHMVSASGIKLKASNTALTKGSVEASLTLPDGGFSKSATWLFDPLLVPENALIAAAKANQMSPQAAAENANVNNITTQKAQVGGQVNLSDKKNITQTSIGGINKDVSGQDLSGKTGILAKTYGYTGQADDAQVDMIEQPAESPFNVFVSNAEDDKLDKLYLQPTKPGLFTYTLNNIYTVDANKASNLTNQGLHLFSTIHTNLQNVATPDLNLNAGDMLLTKTAITHQGANGDLSIPLDTWKLAGKWTIAKGAIKVTGNLFAGSVTLPVTNMEVSETNIGYGDIKVDQIGIAGVYTMPINGDETLTSFGFDKAAKYGTLYNPAYGAWSLSLLPKDPAKALTQLTNLPDLAPNDAISILNISLYSKGSDSRVVLIKNHPAVTLNGFASFIPYQAENGSDYFKLNGALDLNIPSLTGLGDQVYSLQFASDGKKLVHMHQTLPTLKLVTNGIRVKFETKDQVFTNNQLKLVGVLSDKVAESPYNLAVNLLKTSPQEQIISVRDSSINPISMGVTQKLVKISGSMDGTSTSWNNFNFEGDVTGAEGLREKPESGTQKTHMYFEVKGDLVANKAEIGVKNLSMGGATNMNFTYDFEKKAIVGSFHLDEKTSNATFHTDVELQLGNGQWYMLGAAKIDDITGSPLPVNGANGAICIGSCTITPSMLQILQSQFHDGILPNDFQSRFGSLHGALMVSAIDLNIPLIPDINLNLGPLASAKVEKGIYANMYQAISFEDSPRITGGIKFGVYVKVHAGASVLVGCAGLSLSAEVNAQANVELKLPTFSTFLTLDPKEVLKKTELTMNAEAQVLLGGEAYVGFGVCDDDCSSIKVWGVKIPPGCHKEGIKKDMTLAMGMDVFKISGELIPTKGDIYISIFGDKYIKTVNVPNIDHKIL